MYNVELTESQIEQNYDAYLPNNIPVIEDVNMLVTEDEPTALNDLSRNFYDAEDDDMVVIIKSLPTSGTLLNNGAAVSINTVVTDISLLTYTQTTENEFDIAENPYNTYENCTDGVSSDSFTFQASDDVCGDPTASRCQSSTKTARLCIVEKNDLPVAIDGSSVLEARIGRPNEEVEFAAEDDDDDVSFPGKYGMDGGKVKIVGFSFNNPNTVAPTSAPTSVVTKADTDDVLGKFGELRATTSTACDTAIKFDTWYDVTDDKLTLCYVPYIKNATTEIVGRDTFYFKAQDSGGAESNNIASVSIDAKNALSPCVDDGSQLYDYSAPNAIDGRDICTSFGDEDTTISIFLNGKDEVGSREVGFKILSLPSNGILYHVDDESNPTSIGSAVSIGDVVYDGPHNSIPLPNLFFAPSANFFNEINDNDVLSYVMLSGETISTTNDCATPSTGCPLSFTFSVLADSNLKTKITNGDDQSSIAQSPAGTYEIYVDAVVDTDVTLNIPDEIVVTTDPYDFLSNNNLISIEDSDKDEFEIGISIDASRGDIRISQVPASGFELEETGCTNALENGCSTVQAIGFKSAINEALTKMDFYEPGVIGSADTITIEIFKPVQPTKFIDTPIISQKIKILAASDAPAPSGDGNELGGFSIALIAGISSVGVVVFVFIVWGFCVFCKKTAKATSDVRKSIAHKRHSHKPDIEAYGDHRSSRSGRKSHHHDSRHSNNSLTVKHDHSYAKPHRSKDSRRSKHNNDRRSNRMLSEYDSPNAVAPSKARKSRSRKYSSDSSSDDGVDGADMEVADDTIFDWEKHIDKKTGDVYFFNPKTGVSQWDPPAVKAKRSKK